MRKSIDEIYLYIHYSICKKAGHGSIINRKEIEKYLSKNHHYHKPMPTIILKRLENYGLIKFINRDMIKIAKKPIDILQNTTKLFKSAGCF